MRPKSEVTLQVVGRILHDLEHRDMPRSTIGRQARRLKVLIEDLTDMPVPLPELDPSNKDKWQ